MAVCRALPTNRFKQSRLKSCSSSLVTYPVNEPATSLLLSGRSPERLSAVTARPSRWSTTINRLGYSFGSHDQSYSSCIELNSGLSSRWTFSPTSEHMFLGPGSRLTPRHFLTESSFERWPHEAAQYNVLRMSLRKRAASVPIPDG